jgi:hypothetical protein
MNRFVYEVLSSKGNDNTVYSIVIPSGIIGTEELLTEIAAHCGFPYFGFNWNALTDSLCDFHWRPEKKFCLMHSDLPELPEEERAIYIAVLLEVLATWQHDPEYTFTVVFPEPEREKVEAIVEKLLRDKA